MEAWKRNKTNWVVGNLRGGIKNLRTGPSSYQRRSNFTKTPSQAFFNRRSDLDHFLPHRWLASCTVAMDKGMHGGNIPLDLWSSLDAIQTENHDRENSSFMVNHMLTTRWISTYRRSIQYLQINMVLVIIQAQTELSCSNCHSYKIQYNL